ncbi:MAG: hypothetical protein ABIP64_11460 [Burkholderiales bacterium]
MDDSGHYRRTSYRAHALGQANPYLTLHPIYVALGVKDKQRQTVYRALFRTPMDKDAIDDLRLALNQNQPLGNRRFYAKIEKLTGERRARGEAEGQAAGNIRRHIRRDNRSREIKVVNGDGKRMWPWPRLIPEVASDKCEKGSQQLRSGAQRLPCAVKDGTSFLKELTRSVGRDKSITIASIAGPSPYR